MDNEINRQIESAKTDESELNSTLRKYDLDDSLAKEFDEINKQFIQLEIKYQSLINMRRFLNGN